MRGVGVGRDLIGAFDGSIASAQTRVVDARARGYGKDVVEMRVESLARSGTGASSAASQTSRKLLNTMLGSGALAVPGCFAACGWTLTVVAASLACYLCALSLQALIYCAEAHGAWSYDDLASALFGSRGRTVVRWSINALMLGVVVAYVNIVGDNFFTATASGIFPPGTEPSRERVMYGVAFGVFLPLTTLVKTEKSMGKVVNMGLATTFLFALCLLVLSLRPSSGSTKKPDGTKMWDPSGFGVVLPIMIFNFAAHALVFPVLKSSGGKLSTRGVARIANETMCNLWLFYVITGAAGYIAFGSKVSGNVLRNLGAETGFLGLCTQVVRFLYGCAICTGVPLLFISLRENCCSLLLKLSSVVGRHGEFVFDASVLFIALRLSISIPNIQHVFGLIGSTTCALLTFILPGLMFLRTYDHNRLNRHSTLRDFNLLSGLGGSVRLSARGLVLFGIFFGITCTRSTLESLREEAAVIRILSQLLAAQTYVRSKVRVYDKIILATRRFRRIDDAERMVSQLSEVSKTTESAVKDATATFTKKKEDDSRSSLRREIDLLNPFATQTDENALLEAKDKLHDARELYENVSNTLTEVQATLKEREDERSTRPEGDEMPSSSKDTNTLVRLNATLKLAKATIGAIEDADREVDTEDVDEAQLTRLTAASSEVKQTSTLIDDTLIDLREAKTLNAEEVLQAAVDVVEETKNAEHVIEELKVPRSKSRVKADAEEDLVEKIFNVSNSVVENETQTAVDLVLETSAKEGTSDRAVQRASELLQNLEEKEAPQEESEGEEITVLKRFVETTTTRTKGTNASSSNIDISD